MNNKELFTNDINLTEYPEILKSYVNDSYKIWIHLIDDFLLTNSKLLPKNDILIFFVL
jgi:hypothetical protein